MFMKSIALVLFAFASLGASAAEAPPAPVAPVATPAPKMGVEELTVRANAAINELQAELQEKSKKIFDMTMDNAGLTVKVNQLIGQNQELQREIDKLKPAKVDLPAAVPPSTSTPEPAK